MTLIPLQLLTDTSPAEPTTEAESIYKHYANSILHILLRLLDMDD